MPSAKPASLLQQWRRQPMAGSGVFVAAAAHAPYNKRVRKQ